MKRWLWNITCGISLLLCAAAAAFWVHSYQHNESYWAGWLETRVFAFGANRGESDLMYEYFTKDYGKTIPPLPDRGRWFHVHISLFPINGYVPADLADPALTSYWECGPASHTTFRSTVSTPVLYQYELVLPYWIWVSMFLVLPVCNGTVRFVHRQQTEKGHCPKCRYDLRASIDRCPECGTAITVANRT